MFGKLLTFLREQRSKNNYYTFSSDSEHLTSNDLIKFAFQIATGCEYLQSRGVSIMVFKNTIRFNVLNSVLLLIFFYSIFLIFRITITIS